MNKLYLVRLNGRYEFYTDKEGVAYLYGTWQRQNAEERRTFLARHIQSGTSYDFLHTGEHRMGNWICVFEDGKETMMTMDEFNEHRS